MQAIPEHPKRDFIFCLSTAFGDAYLFQVIVCTLKPWFSEPGFSEFVCTLKPRYNEPWYSEFRDLVNKTQIPILRIY